MVGQLHSPPDRFKLMKGVQAELCKMPVEFRRHQEFTEDERKQIQTSINFLVSMTQKVIGVEKIDCKIKAVSLETEYKRG